MHLRSHGLTFYWLRRRQNTKSIFRIIGRGLKNKAQNGGMVVWYHDFTISRNYITTRDYHWLVIKWHQIKQSHQSFGKHTALTTMRYYFQQLIISSWFFFSSIQRVKLSIWEILATIAISFWGLFGLHCLREVEVTIWSHCSGGSIRNYSRRDWVATRGDHHSPVSKQILGNHGFN